MTQEEFTSAWQSNSDGAGYAWKQDGQIHFKKGLMECQPAFEFGEKLSLPFILHLRSSSIGHKKSPELTQPFIISKESPLLLEGITDKVLFHNGTESDYLKYGAAANIYPEKDSITNDSHTLAKIVANDNLRFLSELKSKFAIADKNSDVFTYYGDFINENEQIWYSNLFWKHSKKKTQTSQASEIVGQNQSYYKFGANNTTSTFNNFNNIKSNFTIYEYPWNRFGNCEVVTRVPWERSMGFRYMMNKITVKAAQKIWKKLSQKKNFNFEKAEENALKIMKQQGKGNLNGIDKWLERQKNKENSNINNNNTNNNTIESKEQKLITEQSQQSSTD